MIALSSLMSLNLTYQKFNLASQAPKDHMTEFPFRTLKKISPIVYLIRWASKDSELQLTKST